MWLSEGFAMHKVREAVGDKAFFALVKEWVKRHRRTGRSPRPVGDRANGRAGRRP
ncbi:hypothetical protein [Streptomyces sp. G45]|uniref:hypothetical protein n=1 Tax=Streptomyces sp. G45 TaxID=3406627 RepID=UPI003C184BA0